MLEPLEPPTPAFGIVDLQAEHGVLHLDTAQGTTCRLTLVARTERGYFHPRLCEPRRRRAKSEVVVQRGPPSRQRVARSFYDRTSMLRSPARGPLSHVVSCVKLINLEACGREAALPLDSIERQSVRQILG